MHGNWVRIGSRVAAGALVLVSATACGGAAAPAAAPAPTTPAAATTAAASVAPTSAAAPSSGSRALASVFPDVAADTCAPAGSDVRTGTGAVPTEAYTCDYSAVAPNAQVIFAQWADEAGAQAWYQDTADLGPRIEQFESWSVSGVQQGPLYTAQNANGVVISTGRYQGLPYTWEIRAASLDDVNLVGPQLQLQQSTQLG